MKRLNKAQKKKIKESLLKLLHVTCYILSGLFVLLMVVMGVNSCHQRKISGVSAESEIRLNDLTNTSWSFNDVIDLGDGFDYWLNFEDYDDYNYTRIHANTSEMYYYYGSTISQSNQVYDTYDVPINDYWLDSDYKRIFISGGTDVQNINVINWFYENATINNNLSSFVFNKQFNYNAPLNLSFDSYYGGSTANATHIATNMYRISYYVGPFYSNGSMYDTICLDYINALSPQYLINGLLKHGEDGCLSYVALGFKRVDNGIIDFVNYRTTTQYATSSGEATTYYLNSSYWVNDSFRYLTFYTTVNDVTRVKVDALNNNNQNSVSGYIGSTDGTNVFNLISQAFEAWIPILSLSILPSITIGMLVFLPMVVTIIFVIIRIIKK